MMYLEADIDHIALQTKGDPLALASWYADVLRFAPIDFEQFRAGERLFPGVRISQSCILDFFGPGDGEKLGAGPYNGNHICFALKTKGQLEFVIKALRTAGYAPEQDTPVMLSGARGQGHSVYAKDPEGNPLEFRAYY
jgi:catechol 2,3-dioxygenase-like lactoylglutathione lyase family enzyme